MADQPNLYDAESLTGMGPNAATARLLDLARAEGTSSELATAIRAVTEDRERLLAVESLAKRVREAQRRYFKDRTNESLTTSKDLERKLDGMLGR
jgi:hypothetical protein